LEINGLVPFLIVESDWGATDHPLTPIFSQKTSNENFEIALLFNVVENSGN
jgi:hypothetical protein